MLVRVLRLDDNLVPVGELSRVASLSIDRGASGDAPMLEALTIVFDAEGFTFAPGWVRVETLGTNYQAHGCYWLEARSATVNHGIVTYAGSGYSVLYPASVKQVSKGAYCLAGSDAVSFVADMLRDCPGDIIVSGGAIMPRTLVFNNQSKLSAAWSVLDAIGWRIRLEGDGTKFIEPLPAEAGSVVESAHILPGFEFTDTVTYTREYEGSRPLDLVEVRYPRMGVDVTERIMSQRLEFTHGVLSNETAGGSR